MSKITIEQLTDEDLSNHIEVGASEYSTPEVINRNHVRWKHLENPSGVSVCVSLRNNLSELVGHSFLQRRQLCLSGGKSLRAAIITDLVIVPRERNAAALIGMTRAAKGADGFDFVLHTSNNISDTIYRRLFKFPVVCSLTAAGLPLRVCNAMSRYVHSRFICAVVDFLVTPWRWGVRGSASFASLVSAVSFAEEPEKDRVSKILQKFSEGAGLHFERSSEFLEWRFRAGPISKSDLLWIYSRQECLGYIATRKVSISGLDVLVILDSVLSRPMGTLESAAIKLLCAREGVLKNCDAVFCLANMSNNALGWWGKLPYFRIPDKFLPHPTPIFTHATNGLISVTDQERFFLTLADLDYF